MNILDKIIQDKRKEVECKKQVLPTKQLESSFLFQQPTHSLKNSIQNGTGVIAEFKRRSPSKPHLNTQLNVWDAVKTYQEFKVSGISVLTDGKYFGGSLDDFLLARSAVEIPLLRKDFIIDEFQILEAKSNGADVILLIAAVLTTDEIKALSEFAKSLGLEVLLEVHSLDELNKSLMPTLDIIGVNNRNLKDFMTSIQTSLNLAEFIPNDFVKVSESGIQDGITIQLLRNAGFQGFLIGESFMKTDDFEQNAQVLMANFS